jgi:hypothetical protein
MSEPTAPLDSIVYPPERRLQVTFVPGNVWRTGLVVLAVLAFGLVMRFVLDDGAASSSRC